MGRSAKPPSPPPAPPAPKVANGWQAICWVVARLLDRGHAVTLLMVGFTSFVIWKLTPEGVERIILAAFNPRLFSMLGWSLFLFTVAVAWYALRWQRRIHSEEIERFRVGGVKRVQLELPELEEPNQLKGQDDERSGV